MFLKLVLQSVKCDWHICVGAMYLSGVISSMTYVYGWDD